MNINVFAFPFFIFNTFMNLNEINQMDKEIYSAEFYYYVSLLKC